MLSLLAAVIAPAHAQDSGSMAASLPRVEVNASAGRDDPGVASSALRTAIPIEQTPQSVVVLPRKLLEEQGVQTLSEALRNVSNVRGVDNRDLANGGFLIRGFDAAVLLDGVAVPGYFSTPSSMAAARRVEVIKGPAGTLYGGSQAVGGGGFVGGLVALTTASPETQPAYSAGLRIGTDDERGFTADLNQPLGSEWSVRLVVDTVSQDSETELLSQRRTDISPSLAWRPNPDSELVIRLRQAEVSGDDFSGLPARGTVVSAPFKIPRSRNLTAAGVPDTTTETTSINAQWSQRIDDTWSWNLTVAKLRAELDQRGSFPFPFDYDNASPGPDLLLAGARLHNRFDSWVVSPGATAKFRTGDVGHTVVAGIDYDRTNDDAFLRFSPGFVLGPINVLDPVRPAWVEPDTTDTPDQKNRYRTTAVYAQDHMDLGALTLLLGLRYSRIKVDDVNPAFGIDNESDNHDTSVRVGATYAFTPQVSVFAGYGEGIRVPTFAIFLNPPKPQHAEQTEIGLRLTKLAGVTASLAWFDLRLDNVVVPNPNPTNDPALIGTSIQSGEQRSHGVDLDLTWQASPAWNWLAAFSWMQPEDGSDQLFNVPKTTGRVATRYDFGADSFLPGLGLGLGMTRHGKLPGDAANNYFTPSATVWDSQVSYRLGMTTLGLFVNNLTDKKYFEPSVYFGGGQVTPAPRRSVVATARIDF